jgi:hypothetical protein
VWRIIFGLPIASDFEIKYGALERLSQPERAFRISRALKSRLRTGIRGERLHCAASGFIQGVYDGISHLHGPQGVFARTWSTGAIAFWAVVGLLAFLVLYYWER